MLAESALYLDPIAQDHVVIEQTTSLYLDPIDQGKLIEKSTTSLILDTVSTSQTDNPEEQQAIEKMVIESPSRILHQCVQCVKDAEQVENLIKSLVSEAKHGSHESPKNGSTLEDSEQGSDGLELLEKVDELATKYAQVARKNESLEALLDDLTNKVRVLECKIDKQEQQIHEAESRQIEQERVILAPMRNIYLRQFHDQVREGISKKLSKTPLYAQHQKALKSKVQEQDKTHRFGLEHLFQCDLWKFMHEAHIIAPKLFSKATLWNNFVDEILQDEKLVGQLGLTPESILITRYGRGPEQEDSSFAAHLRDKYAFAEVVTRQNEEKRPFYTELYEFIYKVHPQSMTSMV